MSLSRAASVGKPRRLGLYLPFALLFLLIVAWSVGWLWLRGETLRRVQDAAAGLRAHGGQATWSTLRFGGYPFRLDLDATDLRLADPSGWSVALPSLKSEAYVFAPTRWLLATDGGLTFTRPGAPPVQIAAPLLRASVNSWDEHPPRISFVGDDLVFSGPAGAFPLASAKAVQVYTRAGPDDQGAMLAEVDGGAAAAGTDLGRLAGGNPVSLRIETIISHARALQGPDWRSAASAWSWQGGSLGLQRLSFSAGGTTLDASAGALTFDDQGRLSGWANATLSQGGKTQPAILVFRQGGALLGRTKLGPALQVF